MNITKNTQGKNIVLVLEGRLDTTTAPQLEEMLNSCLPEAHELELDFEKLLYVSSAGLRVLLKAQKYIKDKGMMKLTHVNDDIMEVFEITGFLDILTIE